MTQKELKERIHWIIDQNDYSVNKRMILICNSLKDTIDYYDWVGFYFDYMILYETLLIFIFYYISYPFDTAVSKYSY